MSRKLYALLLPVLAIAAMAMTAGAAQAAPHWFVCEKLGTETGKLIDSECQKGTKGFWGMGETGERKSGAGRDVREAQIHVFDRHQI